MQAIRRVFFPGLLYPRLTELIGTNPVKTPHGPNGQNNEIIIWRYCITIVLSASLCDQLAY